MCIFRKSITSQEWVKYVGRICWPETWIEWIKCSLRSTISSPKPGAFLLSEFWQTDCYSYNCYLYCYSYCSLKLNLVHFEFNGTCFHFSNLCFCSYGDFLAYTRQKKNKTYILKPETGCQGRGIWVTRNPKEIKPHEHMICQQYMAKVSVCRVDVLLILYHTS